MELFVPIKPVSWNRIASAHWRTYKRMKDEMSEACFYALKQSNVRPFTNPVHLKATAHFTDHRIHDADNLFIKPLLDTLVRQGILPTDDSRFVRSVTLSIETGSDKQGILMEFRGGKPFLA